MPYDSYEDQLHFFASYETYNGKEMIKWCLIVKGLFAYSYLIIISSLKLLYWWQNVNTFYYNPKSSH